MHADWRPARTSPKIARGTVSERPKVQLSKSCVGESPPWVQIPPVPPLQAPAIPVFIRDAGVFACPEMATCPRFAHTCGDGGVPQRVCTHSCGPLKHGYFRAPDAPCPTRAVKDLSAIRRWWDVRSRGCTIAHRDDDVAENQDGDRQVSDHPEQRTVGQKLRRVVSVKFGSRGRPNVCGRPKGVHRNDGDVEQDEGEPEHSEECLWHIASLSIETWFAARRRFHDAGKLQP